MKSMRRIIGGIASFARRGIGIVQRLLRLTTATVRVLADTAKQYVAKKRKQLSETTLAQCASDVTKTVAGWTLLFAYCFIQTFCMSIFAGHKDLTMVFKNGIEYALGAIHNPVASAINGVLKGKTVAQTAKDAASEAVARWWYDKMIVPGKTLTLAY